jgi:hypothetical protein
MSADPLYALSALQPWPWLMFYATARKDIENRTWPPPRHLLGQRVAIAASARFDGNEWRRARLLMSTRGLRGNDPLPCRDELDFGAIIGTVELAGCIASTPPALADPVEIQELKNSITEGEMLARGGRSAAGRKYTEPELAAIRDSIARSRAKLAELLSVSYGSPWFVGPYGFVLREPRALAKPIPCKGRQGFWQVPPAIARAVREQERRAA